jgi:hypothetical protein
VFDYDPTICSSIFSLDVKIPSLAPDSAADYKAAASLNSSSFEATAATAAGFQKGSSGSGKGVTPTSISASSSSSSLISLHQTSMFRAAVATSIQQSVEAEILADKLVSEIQVHLQYRFISRGNSRMYAHIRPIIVFIFC